MLRLRDVSGIKRELAELNARHDKLLERRRIAAHADRCAALAGLGARHRRRADVRQRRLCRAPSRPRTRPTRSTRGARTARPRRARRGEPRARRRQALSRAACPRSSPARGASSTCWTCRPARGSAGIGIDATEAEAHARRARRAWSTRIAARSTSSRPASRSSAPTSTLTFYNAAYRSLWDLDAGFLDQSPTDSAVLDRLRAARKLPEEQDFRAVEGRSCTRPIARPKPRSISGICRTAARCASSPRPIPKAA